MKLLTTLAALLISVLSFSQITIWPKAGSNLSWTGGYESSEKTSALGFFAGVAIDIPVSTRFSIRPEISYNELNVSWSYKSYAVFAASPPYYGASIQDEYSSRKESRRYISLPINLVSHFKLAQGDLQVTLGGYISRAVNGSYSIYYVSNYTDGQGNTYHEFIDNKSTMFSKQLPDDRALDSSLYNPLDIGLTAGLGYQINRVLITTQFLYGITSTLPHSSNAYIESLRKDGPTNRSVSLGIAYRLFQL